MAVSTVEPNTHTHQRTRLGLIMPTGVMLLALGLRLYQLGTESLWGDEGCSLRDATYFTLKGSYRPMYYAVLRGWMELGFGGSEFMLRLPAVFFGVGGVWVLYLLAKRLMGDSVALLASLFMAVSVLHINHSQEVRMYSLTAFAVLLSMYYFVLWRDRGRMRYAVGYVVFSLISLLTFPLSVLVLAAQGAYMLMYIRAYRPQSLFCVGCQLVIAIAWLPWLITNMHMSQGFSQGYIASLDKPTLVGTVRLMGDFFLWKSTKSALIYKAGFLGFSLVVILLAVYSLRGFRRQDSNLALVWIWLIIPLVATIALCYSVTNMWMVRYLIFISPAFYILVAKGILSLRNKWLMAGLVLALLVPTLGRLWLYYARPVRPEWRPAVAYVQQHERSGDVIGLYSAGNQLMFSFYYKGNCAWSPMGEDLTPEEEFTPWDDARVHMLFAEFPLKGKRCWLMLSKHMFRGGAKIIEYVHKNYRVLDHQIYNELDVYLFDSQGKPVPENTLGKSRTNQ